MRPGGNVMVRSASEFGTMKAPPIPVKALRVQRAIKLLVNPDASVNITHQTPATMSTVLWPYICPRRPPIRT